MNLEHTRILIIKPSSLGDVVHTLPLVHAIKRVYPSCHIAWIVQKAFAGILANDPDIDELIPISIPSTSDPHAARGTYLHAAIATFRTLRTLRKTFKDRPCDVSLDLHASLRSGLMGLVNSRSLRLGFSDAREFNTFFQNKLVECLPGEVHAVDKNMSFARYLGIDPLEQDYQLVVGTREREIARSFLENNGVGASDAVVYMNPCGRWSTKLWNVESWGRVCRFLAERPGLRLVLAGAPDDVPYLQSVNEHSGSMCLISAGKLNLAESAALIERSSVYLGVDSGPMHIASFVGTPAVALFGPTDPDKVGPYGCGHVVVRREGLPCLGCRKRVCKNRRCMDEIDAGEVAQICLSTLDSSL